MGERTLVPTDGSPLSRKALERALASHPDAEIMVLHVMDPMLAMYEAEARGLPAAREWFDRIEDRADEIGAEAESLAADHDREVTTVVETGRPARAILDYVHDHGIEHVVMGSHGRSGVSRLVLGSVAEQVIRQSPVPVTVVR